MNPLVHTLSPTATASSAGFDQALHTLNTVFGYGSFRGQQADIVTQLISGGNALVLMPTGGGKSLCYQIPAIVRAQQGFGVTVVVSPLIALMHDQVGALHEAGVSAGFLNSMVSSQDAALLEQRMLRGDLTLLYAAPERVTTPRFLALLTTLYDANKLSMFAIDEAHCVSQWGHDFRPEYRELAVLHTRFASTPRVALTATADTITRADIVDKLQLHDAVHYVSSFDRPNIYYQIVEKTNVRKQLLHYITTQHAGEAGIVYCQSRKTVEDIAQLLVDNGIAALPYHAGLDREVRQNNQDAFLRSDTDLGNAVVMVATIAFGMGIDKPDVRFVAHVDMPKNIEAYYQETGRAGRDGLAAHAWLCYGLQDVVNQRRMIDESTAQDDHKQLMRSKLDTLLTMAQSMDCRRAHLLRYFDDRDLSKQGSAYRCMHCDNCCEPAATWDAGTAARMLLSCIYRVQQASQGYGFGAGHIFDILRGKSTDKVLQFKHHTLSTFGIGAPYTELQWRSVLRQLIANNWVVVDAQAYNTLHLGQDAKAFLRSTQPLLLRASVVNPSKTKAQKTAAKNKATHTHLDPAAQARLQALKTWRAQVAAAHALPAYIIFHDATLIAIAQLAPSSLRELATVSGLGTKKLDAYGQDVLSIVAAVHDE